MCPDSAALVVGQLNAPRFDAASRCPHSSDDAAEGGANVADLLGERSACNAGTPAPVVSCAWMPESNHRRTVHPITLQRTRTIRGVCDGGMCRKVKNE